MNTEVFVDQLRARNPRLDIRIAPATAFEHNGEPVLMLKRLADPNMTLIESMEKELARLGASSNFILWVREVSTMRYMSAELQPNVCKAISYGIQYTKASRPKCYFNGAKLAAAVTYVMRYNPACASGYDAASIRKGILRNCKMMIEGDHQVFSTLGYTINRFQGISDTGEVYHQFEITVSPCFGKYDTEDIDLSSY